MLSEGRFQHLVERVTPGTGAVLQATGAQALTRKGLIK